MDQPSTDGLDAIRIAQHPAGIAEPDGQAGAEQLTVDTAVAAHLYWLPHFGYLLAWGPWRAMDGYGRAS